MSGWERHGWNSEGYPPTSHWFYLAAALAIILAASAIEARSDATTEIGAAEGESAAPERGDAQ